MKLFVQSGDGPPVEIPVSEKALRIMRANFNPSGFSAVDIAKLLAAAMFTQTEDAANAPNATKEHGRCAGIAQHYAEIGGIYAVKALTAGLSVAPPPPPAPAAEGAAA